MEFNKYQTAITEELLNQYPPEVKEQLFDVINNIPFIKHLISPERKYARDLPRDEDGKIIIDLAHPHILEDMDYFRPSALHYKKHGCYTLLRPNKNPNSEFMKWITEERRRCWEGYIRPSDGEWVTGYMYWYLNYCPIMLSRRVGGSTKANRVEDFPDVWEGIYWRFHYLNLARTNGHHAIELARRGCGKSYSLASLMSHNFVLGENEEARRRTTTVLTAYQNQYLSVGKDGTLSKFVPMIDFVAENTQFPRLRLKDSPQDMVWQQGYKDKETGVAKGTLNIVMGVSTKDDEGKLRGKRGYIFFEEMGSFPNLLSVYNTVRYGLEDGNAVFGLAYLVGTAAEDASDFSAAKEMLYNPEGYNIQAIPNVYDKLSQGKTHFGYFFPSYINRQGCYNKDGVSDVIKALLEILEKRYEAKYKTADPNTIIRVVAEMPITPAEATIKVDANIFPVTSLTERLVQLDTNPNEIDSINVGTLEFDSAGKVKFKPTADQPIRHFPTKDNRVRGAIEFYQMPEIDKTTGEAYANRYILGHDPVDNDQADTMSLSSTFVQDLWTDQIVAEYTGRQDYAEDNYEICRKLCLFYNGKTNYEAHPYDQLVRMPDGSTKKWEEVKIGDTLFSKDGKTVKVIDIPIDGIDDIYEITLADGRKVEASSNHIWCAYKNSHRYELREYTTKEMFDFGVINSCGQKNFFLPDSGLVEYPKKEVPIDPYTLGLLIAEGSFSKFKKDKVRNSKKNIVEFAAAQEDFEFYKTVIPYKLKSYTTDGCGRAMVIEDIESKLKELGLLYLTSQDKFIPEEYLFNDAHTRLELLKGLMDGDGCAVKSGSSIFVTISPRLSEDIKLLCRSLGIKCHNQKGRKAQIHFNKRTNKYNNWKDTYRVMVCAEEAIFKLPRKVEKQHQYSPSAKGSKANGYLRRTGISSIRYIGRKQCKCVTVDSNDGLYLIGDYVVTHNCNKKGLYSYFAKTHSTHLLTDVLEFLRDKQMVKLSAFGNSAKGTVATAAINSYAIELIRRWLLQPMPITSDDEENQVMIPNLYNIRAKALLHELISFNSEGNFDRVSALGMLMLLREDRMILFQGNAKKHTETPIEADYLGNDDFFTKNYDAKFGQKTGML